MIAPELHPVAPGMAEVTILHHETRVVGVRTGHVATVKHLNPRQELIVLRNTTGALWAGAGENGVYYWWDGKPSAADRDRWMALTGLRY